MYSSSFTRSRGPTATFRSLSLSVTESRMLCFCRRRARRTAGSAEPLSPNSRSKTARGLFSIGSGWVGVRHEMVCV